MKKMLLVLSLMFATSSSWALNPQPISVPYSTMVSSIGFAASQATATITALSGGAYSTGLNTYITNLHIEQYSTATIAGVATAPACTTNNLGGLTLNFPSAYAIGTQTVADLQFANPIQATTATSKVQVMCASTQGVIWNIEMGYYQAP